MSRLDMTVSPGHAVVRTARGPHHSRVLNLAQRRPADPAAARRQTTETDYEIQLILRGSCRIPFPRHLRQLGTGHIVLRDLSRLGGGWSGWRGFRIVDKVRESEEITSFHLVPCDGGALPTYRAGQYTCARVFVPELGVMQPRQYTLSDAPGGMHFRISVKREPASATAPGASQPDAAGAGEVAEYEGPRVASVVKALRSWLHAFWPAPLTASWRERVLRTCSRSRGDT